MPGTAAQASPLTRATCNVRSVVSCAAHEREREQKHGAIHSEVHPEPPEIVADLTVEPFHAEVSHAHAEVATPAILWLLEEVDPRVESRRVRREGLGALRKLVKLGPGSCDAPDGALRRLALILAPAGLYGVITQSIGQRAKELGVRVALGASSADVVGVVMRRMLSALLFGVSPTDPLTYEGVGLMLARSAAVAGWIPARAILRTNPSSVLREEWEGRRVCDALTPPRS